MKWFQGSMNEAVAASKAKKAIFVAFIEGKDEASTQVCQTIESPEITSRLEQDHFVAVKIESGSETYKFFVQIYQLVPVPSVFFISETGVPLEIVANNYEIPELLAKIDSILAKAGKMASGSSENFIKSEQQANVSSSVVIPTVSKSEATNEPQAAITNKMEEAASELTHEEKIKRAQQLIEIQKKQRIEDEMKKAKERELERRKRERELQELRLRQRELEIKQSHDERLKEKAEDAAARERVREQIAQDRLLRKEKELALKKKTSEQPSEKQMYQTPPASSNDASVTKIQFRLPSGSTHMGQFEPTVTLMTIRNYVISNIELPFQQFVMSTSFPRRELVSEDDDKTLIDLGLVPTCVILILPLKSSNSKSVISSSENMGFISRILWTVLTPVIGVYNYVMQYFFKSNRRTERSQDDEPSTSEFRNITNNDTQNVSNMQQGQSLRRRNLMATGSQVIKSQGNVHRLHTPSDDNDENNTWNGNSTQQM